jgi:hypothetical protein
MVSSALAMVRLDWRTPLLLTHRWLGIAGCVLFIAWFASGIVMMYARMPVLANEERLARAQDLDLSAATLSPEEAAAGAGVSAERVQVGMLLGRPVYRFGGRDQVIVFADTGEPFIGLDEAAARAAAQRYAPGYEGALRYDAYMIDPDQWTLQAGALMPIHRFALDDDAGTRLYVSEVTGDVVLRTTRRERFWAYLGPVLHWLYFTPFRSNGPVWSRFVIWSSLIGCVMCVAGLLWGLVRFSPSARFRIRGVPAASPYAGTMKWHHYSGLIFGAVTLTWAYSGLLSMAPFNWFSTSGLTREQREASSGGPVRTEALSLESVRRALAAFRRDFTPRELEVVQFRGEPYWAADRPLSAADAARWMHAGLLPRAARPVMERRYVSAAAPEDGVFSTFGRDAMPDIARAAMPGVPVRDEVWLDEYDGYYYDPRGSRSLPVLRVRYADPQETWLYLDPARGGIVQKSERVSRLRRWLYQGLHSLDFPFLYFRRPLWDLVVIVLSAGGIVLSVTTVLPAWRRLRRHARTFWRAMNGWREERRVQKDPPYVGV